MRPNTPDATAPPSERADLTCPWWLIGGLALGFVALAYIARGPNTLRMDLTVSGWVQSFDGRVAAIPARIGDTLGERPIAISLLAVIWVGLALMKRRRDLWFVSLVLIEQLLTMPLKRWFDSPRPADDQVELLLILDNTGFPSGHATTSAFLLGTVAFLLARHIPVRRGRLLILARWVIGVSLTSYARIWYGAHWFTDTIGGAIVGLVILLLAANLSATITAARSSGWRRRRTRTPA